MGTTIIPYLSFSGNCEEAIKTYTGIFGGEILFLSRWDENNCKREDQIGKVMHAEFLVGDTRMSGGDNFDESGSRVKLLVHVESKEKALECMDKLKVGGKVISPLQPHPAPDDAGMGSMTMDKFGFVWIIDCPNPEKQPNR